MHRYKSFEMGRKTTKYPGVAVKDVFYYMCVCAPAHVHACVYSTQEGQKRMFDPQGVDLPGIPIKQL